MTGKEPPKDRPPTAQEVLKSLDIVELTLFKGVYNFRETKKDGAVYERSDKSGYTYTISHAAYAALGMPELVEIDSRIKTLNPDGSAKSKEGE